MALYAIVKNGVVIDAPVTMVSNYNGVGGFHKLTDEQRNKCGWFPAVVLNQTYNQKTHFQNPPVCTFNEETQTVTVEYQLIPKSIDQIRREMLSELAAIRYKHETSGITVAGALIATDRESQSMVAAAHASIAAGFVSSIDWKSESGWRTIGETEVGAIAHAVSSHVQMCFSAERAVASQIASAPTIQHLLTINVAAAFEDAMQ